MLKLTVLLCAHVLLLSALQAHDLYLLPDSFRIHPGAKVRVAFHNGDAFPESEVGPDPERLKDALLRSSTRSSAVSGIRISGNKAVGMVEASGTGCLFLSVRTVPNVIELAPDKFVDYLKEEGLTKVIRWRGQHHETGRPGRERYTKFAKSLLVAGRPDDFYKQPLGLLIEIVPLADPYTLHEGAVLPVRVLFRGKPAPDLQLEAAWAGDGEKKIQVVGRTDAEGRIEIPLTKAGKWRLHSLMMKRCSDPTSADWESFWASLTFEVR